MTRGRPLAVAFAALLAMLLAGGWASAPGAAQQATPAAGVSSEDVARPGESGTLPGNPEVQLVKVAEGLADPINVASAPDDGRLFIVERPGLIRILDENGDLVEEPFLDISNEVKIDFLEQGLLGLAFHPQYADNGRFFVFYSDYRTQGDHFLVEYRVSDDDPNVADPDSARVLFSFEDPYVNHNGGTILFGPDGYLYVTIGDGGLAGDPYENAQDISNPLGKLLRIDVDAETARGADYAIPEGNPFEGEVLQSSAASRAAQADEYHPDAQPEIWAYGLRNAWQFSFDRETGDLYITDVGQNAWEEINFQPAGSEGGQNYGWDFLEGAHCYPPQEEEACAAVGTLPVAEYSHADGSCSITGIGVYRGEESPSLDGVYFTSDFCSGKIWGLARDDNGGWIFQELLDTSLLATGSGHGANGELYLTACECEFDRGYDPFENPNGTLWRLVAADQVPDGAETAPLEGEDEGEATPAPEGEEAVGTPTS